MQVPDFMKDMIKHSNEGFCSMLSNPELWSDSMIRKTMEKAGSQAFNIEDAQMLIKNYLSVLCDTVQSETKV